MKVKISVMVDKSLIRFLDSLPGKTRSEKLERALSILKQWDEERQLRQELAAYRQTKREQHEQEDWERFMEQAMWKD